MSELQHYYDNFRTGWWAQEDPEECPCHGSGWALSEVDTFHTCRIHYKGQLSPEDYEMLYSYDATPEQVLEADRASRERFKNPQKFVVVTASVQNASIPDSDDNIPF